MPRTRVVWKWEDENDEGERVGPVWIDRFESDSPKPDHSMRWEQWASRSEAEQYAKAHGFEFLADE